MACFVPSLRLSAPGELRVSRAEALRYLGFGKAEPDEAVLELMASCEEELLAACQGRACWVRTPVAFPAPHCVDIGFGPIESIGIGADRLAARWSRLRPSRSAVLDALASSAVECWCDDVERELTQGEEKHCERFSPGYGDFPLHHQKDFLHCLDMGRLLGVSLTDSLLMKPAKSVTAVIGLGASARTCGHKCLFCDKKNCIYREVMV